MSRLGELEQMLLLTAMRVGPDAYGLSIRQELEARTGHKVSHGAAYATLERLVAKGYLGAWMGEPSGQRGGRAKRHFRILPAGVAALRESHQTVERLRDGLEGMLDGP